MPSVPLDRVPAERSAISSADWRVVSTEDDLFRQPSEVLDEEDAQADRDRPQLSDRQRLDLLIGEHHSTEALRIEATVRVRQVRPGEAEHPWVALEVTAGQFR